MSRKLWVGFLYCFESVHREVTSERPLLAAPQGYLRGQRARARLVREDPYHPRPPLYLLEQTLQHVRRAQLGVVASREGKVGQRVPYARLEDGDRLRETFAVELYELFGQGPGCLLASDLEDRLEIICHLAHLAGRHVGEYVAFEMHHAPLPPCPRQLARYRCLYPLVVVRDHQLHSRKASVHYASMLRGLVDRGLLRAGYLYGQDLPKALLLHSYAHQKRHRGDPRSPTDLQVGGV